MDEQQLQEQAGDKFVENKVRDLFQILHYQ